jgi:hypothetical protein
MAAMLASVVILVIVVEVLRRNPGITIRSGSGFELLRIVFYAVSIAMVFTINVVHGLMLKRESSDDIGRIAARLTTVNVVASALAETPVILGFVLFVGWGYRTDFYILGFVSLYLMFRHFPFYGQWEKFARQRMGNKWPSGPVSG